MVCRYSFRSSNCCARLPYHLIDPRPVRPRSIEFRTMPTFRYEALNASREPVSGQFAAESVQLAIEQLHAQGLEVQSIVPATLSTDPQHATTAASTAAPPS